jgi:hypothetical protein
MVILFEIIEHIGSKRCKVENTIHQKKVCH